MNRPRVRRILASSLCALVVAVAGTSPSASADPNDELAELVRVAGNLPEVRRLVELHHRLDELLERYRRIETQVGRARLVAATAMREAETAAAAVDAAEAALAAKVRSAYQLGTGASVEAVLGASSLPELATIAEFASRSIAVDEAAVRQTVLASAIASATRARAEAEEAALEPRLEELRGLLGEMEVTIDEASALAVQARIEEEARRAFEEQQRRIADALTRTGSWDLGVIDYQQDQSHLLALLGPTGGRTCETPEGLVATGRSFSGFATWYGWEFGGNPTATGAIFDPRLFTAANRWLPFGTFLRVRHEDRCAVVLINDRGPYGNLERVIDLSMAAGQYLGVGVSWVDAEILVPSSALPA